jgi:flavin reductase (DIM6/NTAB) family NADH-FMN oxidoreductase RutF
VERIVGAAIVNRFPYVLAISVCRRDRSARHHARRRFRELLEGSGSAAVQLLAPGPALDQLQNVVAAIPQSDTGTRIAASGLDVRSAEGSHAPVFKDAYLVYEGQLAEPARPEPGTQLYPEPWLDCGSHRIYFLEVTAIQLRSDIADGRRHIHWRSLPSYRPHATPPPQSPATIANGRSRYQKPYTPHYAFPAPTTIAFTATRYRDDMAIQDLPRSLPTDVTLGNDDARWPCFFPCSLGMLTSRDGDRANLMPCGSTTIVSRQPFVIALCISYAQINDRYSARASLQIIQRSGRFGCAVPFIDPRVLDAIRYAGNTTLADDPRKLHNAGLRVLVGDQTPLLPDLPVQFEAKSSQR